MPTRSAIVSAPPAPPTIYALATAPGRSGVAIIRISGPMALSVLSGFTGIADPEPRYAYLASLHAVGSREHIDSAVAIYFAQPASFTGDDVVEFQLHGSPAIIQRVLAELAAYDGCRMAEPGEFTERAYLNGKLDLTEVEGLADLIAADTEEQRKQALAHASGILRQRAATWRRDLIHARALIEAVLDFSDEPDVTDGPISEARQIAMKLAKDIGHALADTGRAETIRNGYRVAIVGPPNVGKSSLMNILAARDVAIVSDVPGTTRDSIEVHLDLNGISVTLTDTAGIRSTDNPVEIEGIRRARLVAESADLILDLNDNDMRQNIAHGAIPRLTLRTKADLMSETEQAATTADHIISTQTGQGISDLLAGLTRRCAELANRNEPALVTRERHRIQLEDCKLALQSFTNGTTSDLELRAEDLRHATTAIARLTGEIDAEDVLDDIFSGFCIGK